tara:strand:- start:13583 stop:14101 length:519 start_codon:yes stop_codon:yes gene_type:complete
MIFKFSKFVIGVTLSLILFFSVSSVCWAESKLGFVRVNEVIRKADIYKKAEDKLKKEFASRDGELKKMGAKLKKLVSKFEKEQAVMSSSDKQKMQREIKNFERDLQRKQREANEDLNQRKSEELAGVVEKARAVIKQIAEEEKFDLILENSVYASPKIDITSKVIKALNAKR